MSSQEPKGSTRFAATGHNKENRHQSENNQISSTGVNEQWRNLLKWLEKGRSLKDFRHLRWFGLHMPSSCKSNSSHKSNSCVKEVAPATEVLEGKEQSDFAEVKEAKESVENANQLVKETIEDNDYFGNYNLEDVKNILSDLHELILASYPRDQCEEWLHVIRRKFPNLDFEPLYWECLAALEEARGDYIAAIDLIVSGAKAEDIDKSLDLLWQKFTSLKLQLTDDEVDKKKQKSHRLSVDQRQAFKSSVIKFTLQRKAIKQPSADLGVETIFALCCNSSRKKHQNLKFGQPVQILICSLCWIS